MKKLSIMLFLCLSLPAFAEPQMGINLAGICDWNTELPFVDVFRKTRAWISQKQGESWGKGPVLNVDEHGWVRHLESHCFAEVPLCTIDDGHYPSGTYTVLYEGEGELRFQNAQVKKAVPGKILLEVDSSKGAFWLQICKTNPENYVRNIHVYLPGFGEEKQRKDGLWNPDFLKRWRGMKVVRFMDFQRTNGSKLQTWNKRSTMSDAVFSQAGAPLEVMCDLVNRLDADPWFCVPHLADDAFVRQMARCLKKHLDPQRKIYLEYSNEVWNGQFEQNRYAAKQGQKLGFSKQAWEAAWCFTAYRSVQIFQIFEEEFGGHERFVRILPSQAANPYVSGRILEFQDAYRHADALAIAPYLTWCISKEKAAEIVAMGEAGILKYMEETALPESIRWMTEQKKIAEKYGLKLVAYEAGQHLVGLGGANNDENLNRLLYAANASEKMGELYEKYFDAWENIDGDVLCHFSSVSRWSKWGSWGLLEYADSPWVAKYRAVQNRKATWNH